MARHGLEDWLLLLALVVLWGSAFGLTDLALAGFSPLQVVTGRLWIGALVLLVTMGPPRRWLPRDARSWRFLVAMSVFGNVLGLLTQTRLPSSKWMKYYDPRCSGEHFGVLASCAPQNEDGLKDLFQKQGAVVKVFE